MALKTGKLEARPGAVKFTFQQFANIDVMPPPPSYFGHERLIRQWGMLGNDVAGDCVFAGSGHEIMLWNAEAGKHVPISDETALRNYSEFTGYDPKQTDRQGNNPTDNGTYVDEWLAQRRKVGFADDNGERHKIGAYIALEPGNIDQLRYASYYFDGVGIGVKFPREWMTLFQQGGRTWPAIANPHIEGGHYITCTGWHGHRPSIVSWGRRVELTTGAYVQFCDEAYAYLTPEKLVNGVDLEGFNFDKLTDMLSQLRNVK